MQSSSAQLGSSSCRERGKNQGGSTAEIDFSTRPLNFSPTLHPCFQRDLMLSIPEPFGDHTELTFYLQPAQKSIFLECQSYICFPAFKFCFSSISIVLFLVALCHLNYSSFSEVWESKVQNVYVHSTISTENLKISFNNF